MFFLILQEISLSETDILKTLDIFRMFAQEKLHEP